MTKHTQINQDRSQIKIVDESNSTCIATIVSNRVDCDRVETWKRNNRTKNCMTAGLRCKKYEGRFSLDWG